MDLKGTPIYHLHRIKQSLHQSISTILCRTIAWIKGVQLGSHFACRGIPYFYRSPHSIIQLGSNCKIWSSFKSNNIGAMQRSRICTQTPVAQIHIGNNVGMSAVTIVSHQHITIEDDAMIGAGTLITDSDWHSLSADVIERHTKDGKTAPVTIGHNAFIGTRCIILKGVNIGANAVVGAGSVVTCDIPAGAIAAGNPCHIVRMS